MHEITLSNSICDLINIKTTRDFRQYSMPKLLVTESVSHSYCDPFYLCGHSVDNMWGILPSPNVFESVLFKSIRWGCFQDERIYNFSGDPYRQFEDHAAFNTSTQGGPGIDESAFVQVFDGDLFVTDISGFGVHPEGR